MILTGLIGWPVGHSKSPAMHNAAFRAMDVDGYYALLPTPPNRIGEAVMGLRALGFRGANVTVPYKHAVIPWLEKLTPEARAIGAVNTIIVEADGALAGANTDAAGFLSDLEALGAFSGAEPLKSALILGAGGSARAVAYALTMKEIAVQVLARRPKQAYDLVASITMHAPAASPLTAHPWSSLRQLAPKAQLIVNCTPVGMSPEINASPWPDDLPFRSGQMVYDLVYNPNRTRLMAQAEANGARAWNGLGMLVRQGARAWELWTGLPAPIEVMRMAATSKSGAYPDE